MTITKLSNLAFLAYLRFGYTYTDEFEGKTFYGSVYGFCSEVGIENKFLRDYGIAGDWEDVDDGRPILIDVGEFIQWVNSFT